jgi:DDE family transposase
MDPCATPRIRFAPPVDRPLDASFDAGRLTSDGGLAWLREAEDDLGRGAALAAEGPEWRRGTPHHTLRTLVTQCVGQIACGDEDQTDATTWRRDPLLTLVCGRLPSSDRDRASHPTLARLANAVNTRACERWAWALGPISLRARERAGGPTRIVRDLDGTDDPTHGH